MHALLIIPNACEESLFLLVDAHTPTRVVFGKECGTA